MFTCEEYMRLEYIYYTRHKWQKVDSMSYNSYQQRVCKIKFLMRTFVKTNSKLMSGSF